MSAEKIKELRAITQAGFMDCKKALEASDFDLDKAVKWLKEKGMAKAAKKASAIAAEGYSLVLTQGNKAVLIEINTQTDFVSKNDEFVAFVKDAATTILHSDSATDFLKIKLSTGLSIEDTQTNLTAKIGEKIVLRRAEVFSKTNDQSFGIYQHANNRISTLVIVDKKDKEDIGKDLAMHIAAMNPKFLDENNVDKEWLVNEKEIILKKTIAEGKDPKFAEKTVEGRLKKALQEVCLVHQSFIKQPDLTIGQLLKNNGINLVVMKRYEVGEGIEKIQTDFAKEVEAQMKK